MKNFILVLSIFLTATLSSFAQESLTSDSSINNLIAKKRNYNKNYKEGFRIQLYYGSEGSARRIKTRFQNEYPDIFTKLHYKDPFWKVAVGNYKTKLAADRALLKIKEKFRSAIVVPIGK